MGGRDFDAEGIEDVELKFKDDMEDQKDEDSPQYIKPKFAESGVLKFPPLSPTSPTGNSPDPSDKKSGSPLTKSPPMIKEASEDEEDGKEGQIDPKDLVEKITGTEFVEDFGTVVSEGPNVVEEKKARVAKEESDSLNPMNLVDDIDVLGKDGVDEVASEGEVSGGDNDDDFDGQNSKKAMA